VSVHDYTHVSRQAAREARASRANQKAADLAPIIVELRAAGITSFGGIAAALTKRRIPTPADSRRWHAKQVARVLTRLPDIPLCATPN
jgi:hypothetical protein